MKINSDRIKLFPISKPRSNDPTSRLFYEDNIANMLRQIVGENGFVINAPKQLTLRNGYYVNAQEDLEFNIYGYYVNIKADTNLIESNGIKDYIYAQIIIDNSSIPEIKGQDNAGIYEGLEIISSDTIKTNIKDNSKKTLTIYLLLYKKNNGSFIIEGNTGFIENRITGIDGKVN